MVKLIVIASKYHNYCTCLPYMTFVSVSDATYNILFDLKLREFDLPQSLFLEMIRSVYRLDKSNAPMFISLIPQAWQYYRFEYHVNNHTFGKSYAQSSDLKVNALFFMNAR